MAWLDRMPPERTSVTRDLLNAIDEVHAERNRRIEELRAMLIRVTDELAGIVADERCDHAVNICWCEARWAIADARRLVEATR